MDNTNISNLGEVTLNYKYHNPSIKDRPLITNAADAVAVIKLVIDMQRIGLQEQFIVIYLNQANKVIGTPIPKVVRVLPSGSLRLGQLIP